MAKKKEILADYWDKQISISVPEETVVPVVPDPPLLKNPEEAVRKALDNPIGAPSLLELAKKAKGGKIVIAHDDLTRPALPRKIMIPEIMKVLNQAGIQDEDVFLLSANGNHCKFPDWRFRAHFGEEIYCRFPAHPLLPFWPARPDLTHRSTSSLRNFHSLPTLWAGIRWRIRHL